MLYYGPRLATSNVLFLFSLSAVLRTCRVRCSKLIFSWNCTAKRKMLLGRLESILQLNVEIADFQVKLQEAVKDKELHRRSGVLSISQSPLYLFFCALLES